MEQTGRTPRHGNFPSNSRGSGNRFFLSAARPVRKSPRFVPAGNRPQHVLLLEARFSSLPRPGKEFSCCSTGGNPCTGWERQGDETAITSCCLWSCITSCSVDFASLAKQGEGFRQQDVAKRQHALCRVVKLPRLRAEFRRLCPLGAPRVPAAFPMEEKVDLRKRTGNTPTASEQKGPLMTRTYVFGIGRGCRPTIGFAWLLGILILLVWASPAEGQSANNRATRSAGIQAGGTQAGDSMNFSTGPAASPRRRASTAVQAGFSVVARGASSEVPAPGGGAVGQTPAGPGRYPQSGFWPFSSSGIPTAGAAAGSPTASPPEASNPGDGGVSFRQPSSPPETSGKSPPPSVLPSDSSVSVLPGTSSPAGGSKSLLQSEPVASGKTDGANGNSLPARPARLREGSRISQQKGTFTITGDRVIFSALNGQLPRMVVLENLSLQRVLQNIHASPEQEIWLVTGRVTEFQGINYLLLERATRIDEADLEQPPSASPPEVVQPAPPAPNP